MCLVEPNRAEHQDDNGDGGDGGDDGDVCM